MKNLHALPALLLLVCAASTLPAVAAENSQQSKMSTCNVTASEQNLDGDARKKFMKKCLSAKPANAQQQKMQTCNAEASSKSLSGDERKQFMSTCLKGS